MSIEDHADEGTDTSALHGQHTYACHIVFLSLQLPYPCNVDLSQVSRDSQHTWF